MTVRTDRRRLVAGAIGLAAGGSVSLRSRPATPAFNETFEVVVSADAGGDPVPFSREDFGTVGIYDIDWLTEPGFSVLLDNLAASPGAFHGVRFFGAFTSGTPERFEPESGGTVWADPDAPIDFSRTLDALEALTTRGLVPFVVFGFFPPAVSSSPIHPPTEWGRWKTLVQSFLQALEGDPRFGAAAIARWRFEAWNEPNEGRFWTGTEQEYHDLYRVTSAAVVESGLPIRLGGPAIAYKPQENPDFGEPWMGRFLQFIADDPTLRCDFVSLHRKGTVGDDPPDPRRLHDAAIATIEQAAAIDPDRFAGITVIDDEADEKVGFETPYAPRVNERNASWLAAVTAVHAGLGERYRDAGARFIAAADNANLQLVEAPFDGRRSIMTLAGDDRTDLLKIPAYGFYEMLRLLGDRQASVVSGGKSLFPETDLYHLATAAGTHIACLLTYYPDADGESPPTRSVDYVVRDIPWPRVNVARFQIDRELSNAWAAAGGVEANPFPVPEPARIREIRQAQELALVRPIARDVSVDDGIWHERIQLPAYATTCLWITPVEDRAPAAPSWLVADVRDGNVVLRWQPIDDAALYGYEVVLLKDGTPIERLSPDPLRAAMWVDTDPPPDRRVYGVRAVSASGSASAFVTRDVVVVPNAG